MRSDEAAEGSARREWDWRPRGAGAADSREAIAERRWRLPLLAALVATIPAFYAELLLAEPPVAAPVAYLVAAAMLSASLWHAGRRGPGLRSAVVGNLADVVLVAGLLAAAFAPPSHGSTPALVFRLVVAFASLVRMVWILQHALGRGGLPYLMATALAVLLACGAGYWWLEPTTPTLGEGLWLAFVTAATVGYGDVVPTTTASKIFSVFVVLLGFGVLTMVTASIAAKWVQTEERLIEREILRKLHAEVGSLRSEVRALRDALEGRTSEGEPM